MNKLAVALASALIVSATALTSTAQAGGLRIGFGFPLGAFIAHSKPFGGGGGYHSRRHVTKSYTRKPVAVARRQKAEPAKVARVITKDKVAKVITKEKTEIDSTTEAVYVNKPRIGDITQDNTTAQAPVVTEKAKVEKTPEATNTTVAAVTPAEELKKDEEVASEPVKKSSGSLDCRRFIPAVGVTISVRCD